MSLIWADGFENSSLWSRKYTLTSTVSGITSDAAGRNGNGVKMNVADNSLTLSLPSASQHATIITGFAFKALGATDCPSTTGSPLIRMSSDGGATFHNQVIFSANTGGNLLAYRHNANLLGTSSGLTFTTGTWYFIEAKFILGDAGVGRIILKGNGTQILDTGLVDTKNAGTASVYDTIRIGYVASGGTTGCMFDDWYILNGAGSVYNDFLGDITVETIRPDGNGNSSQWVGSDGNSTDNYLLVDEATYSAADYVESGTTNNKDLYTYGALAASSGTVKGVVATAVASKTASGTQNFRQITRISSTNYNGSSVALDTSDLPRTQVWEQSPATSSDWTISEVNGAEFGVEVL